jgi:hypothetical protein
MFKLPTKTALSDTQHDGVDMMRKVTREEMRSVAGGLPGACSLGTLGGAAIGGALAGGVAGLIAGPLGGLGGLAAGAALGMAGAAGGCAISIRFHEA